MRLECKVIDFIPTGQVHEGPYLPGERAGSVRIPAVQVDGGKIFPIQFGACDTRVVQVNTPEFSGDLTVRLRDCGSPQCPTSDANQYKMVDIPLISSTDYQRLLNPPKS